LRTTGKKCRACESGAARFDKGSSGSLHGRIKFALPSYSTSACSRTTPNPQSLPGGTNSYQRALRTYRETNPKVCAGAARALASGQIRPGQTRRWQRHPGSITIGCSVTSFITCN
jgi:hypothetical protein